ncbi:MAG: prepilin peptidase [Rhodomicrobium sp.]
MHNDSIEAVHTQLDARKPLFLDLVCGSLFLYCVIVIARDDLAFRIVPDRFLLIMFAAGALHGFLIADSEGESLVETISRLAWRSAAPGLCVLSVAMLYRLFRRKDGLGLGDIKLLAAAGIWLPVLSSFYAIAAASIAALVLTVAITVWRAGTVALTHSLPFAVFLAPAFWLLWLLERMQLLAL